MPKNQPEILKMTYPILKRKTQSSKDRKNGWIISELENNTEKFTWNEAQKHKEKKDMENRLRNYNVYLIEVPEENQ